VQAACTSSPSNRVGPPRRPACYSSANAHTLSIGELGASSRAAGPRASSSPVIFWQDRAPEPRVERSDHLDAELAWRSRSADARRAAGESGPLLGIPLIHKDIFCTDGVRTSCGSRMLDIRRPLRCHRRGAAQGGGCGDAGQGQHGRIRHGFPMRRATTGRSGIPGIPPRCPADLRRSAAATAARLTPFATGTDTGGSIRQPRR